MLEHPTWFTVNIKKNIVSTANLANFLFGDHLTFFQFLYGIPFDPLLSN